MRYQKSLYDDSNIFCDLLAGLGEKAQAGGDYIPLPFTGSCTGQLNAHIHAGAQIKTLTVVLKSKKVSMCEYETTVLAIS